MRWTTNPGPPGLAVGIPEPAATRAERRNGADPTVPEAPAERVLTPGLVLAFVLLGAATALWVGPQELQPVGFALAGLLAA